MPILRRTHSNRIERARRDGHLRDVSLGARRRQVRQVRGERVLHARLDVGDLHLAPPAPDLDDERDVVAHGDVRERERAVGRGERVGQRLARCRGAAAIASHPGREGLDVAVRDVDDGVVEGVGVARRGRRDHPGHRGRASARALHLLALQVAARAARLHRPVGREHRVDVGRGVGRGKELVARAGAACPYPASGDRREERKRERDASRGREGGRRPRRIAHRRARARRARRIERCLGGVDRARKKEVASRPWRTATAPGEEGRSPPW